LLLKFSERQVRPHDPFFIFNTSFLLTETLLSSPHNWPQ
jgi:hypothetical protein